MADGNEGTTAPEAEAQSTAPEGEAPESQAAGTPPQVDEVTTLRSRNAGLDAKVTKLQDTAKAEKARADELQKKLDDYISGKASEDEDTRALLLRLNSELAASQAAAKVAGLAVKYPETYGTVGDAIAAMSEDQLEAAEARFRGVPVESNTPPPPVGNNAQRPAAAGTKPLEEMTLDELKAHGAAAFANTRWNDLAQTD